MRGRTAMGAAVVLLVALAAMPAGLGAQQRGTIRGTIKDAATTRPLSGAQVAVVGTGRGALADANGAYVIPDVAAGAATVRVTMLGYGPAEQQVTVTAGASATADFELAQTAVALNELVVTATGETRKREIGNSVSAIGAAEISRAPVATPQDILAGRSVGVTVLQNSGQPGAGGSIRLRGNNSISQGNDPIVYVDGIRIYNGHAPTSIAARQADMPLNDISPEDIERIEIVKGPAATTLYGTEASGGIIQIFTKSGVTGEPRWNAEVSEGFNRMGHVGPSSDPTGLFVNECSGPNLVIGDGTRFEDPTCPSSGSWLKHGAVQRYGLSVRGGAGDVTYYMSGNYGDSRGVVGNGGSADGGFRGNFSFRPTRALQLGLNTAYTRRNTQWIQDGNNGSGFLLNVSRGPDGNFKAGGCSDPEMVCVHNSEIFTTDATTKADHYVTGLLVNYTPNSRFSNKLNVGFDYNNLDNQTLDPFGFLRVPLGEMWWDGWKRTLLSADYAGSFHAELFGLASTSSWGGQIFDSRTQATSVDAADFSGPGAPTLTSAARRDVTNSEDLRVVNAGFFLQETVALRDRLFVTGGLRVDGNSSFGQSFGLQPYPKVSASYVLSDYAWWPKPVESFKLRGAIGESGKAPGAFDAVRTWLPVAGDNGQPGFTPDQIGNADLGPERTRETELGFEGSALQGRLGVDFTYYRQHTFDALVPVVYPPSQGFSNRQLENVGQLFNNGIELRLDVGLLRRESLDWSARLNLSTINSKAGDLGGQVITVNSLSRTYVQEGYAVPSYFGRKVTNPTELADPQFEENAYIGAAYPTKIIAPSTTLTLMKRLTFDAMGEWQLGGHLLNALAYQNAYKSEWQPCYAAQAAIRASKTDPSALDGTNALDRARCTLTSGVRDYALWVEPTNFFKLRSVSLSYQIPEGLVPGAHGATLTVAGRNLLTSTKYSGTDPEVADFRDGSFSRRDYYVLPTPATFLATLRLNF